MESAEIKNIINEELTTVVHDILLPAMQAIADETNKRFDETNERIDGVEKSLQGEIKFLRQEMNEQFATKDDLAEVKSEILTAVDGLAKQVRDVKDDQTANLGAHYRFEERLEKIESKLSLAPAMS